MKWTREPLVHFLLLGAALFGIFALWGGPPNVAPGQYQIVITSGLVQNLALGFQRAAGRAPTAGDLDAVLGDYVREEILDREARAQGLDQDDPVVRAQLRQRMEYYLQDTATVPEPTDAQLQAYLQASPGPLRRADGTTPPLAEVRDAVKAAWLADQRRQTANAAYEKLRAKYHVVIESPTAAPAAGNTTAPTPPPTKP